MEADIIIYNGLVRTPLGVMEALAVTNGRITAVGSNEKILRYASADTILINAGRRSVLPGFTDSHIHITSLGFSLERIDLSGTRSIEEIKQLVSAKASKTKPGEWIIGRGWDQERLAEKRMPKAGDLDEAAPKHPVLLIRVCGHIAVANTKAMEFLKSYKPNGLFAEEELAKVMEAMPKPSLEDRKQAVKKAIKLLVKNGITSIHAMSCSKEDVKALTDMENLPVRMHIYMNPKDYVEIDTEKIKEKSDGRIRIAGVKLFLDGSLGARTAALHRPYQDAPGENGVLLMDHEKASKIMREFEKEGAQIAVHAIGDRAVNTALKAFKKLRCPTKHRIEHASLLSEKLLSLLLEVKPIVSVQPQFIISDFWAFSRLGEDRIRWLYPFKTLLNKGLLVVSGSDSPVEEPNPLLGIYAAVTRGMYENVKTYEYTRGEALSVDEALLTYTVFPLKAVGLKSGGVINPGGEADIVILSENFNTAPVSEIKKIRVAATIAKGRLVYYSPSIVKVKIRG